MLHLPKERFQNHQTTAQDQQGQTFASYTSLWQVAVPVAASTSLAAILSLSSASPKRGAVLAALIMTSPRCTMPCRSWPFRPAASSVLRGAAEGQLLRHPGAACRLFAPSYMPPTRPHRTCRRVVVAAACWGLPACLLLAAPARSNCFCPFSAARARRANS